MLKNYLVVAFRHVLRHRVHSSIKVVSLAIGIAFFILTSLHVHSEWTYDTFHSNSSRIYRIYQSFETPNGEVRKGSYTPTPLAHSLAEHLPDIEKIVRFRQEKGTVKYRDEISVENLLFVDSGILEVFSFPLLRGDVQGVLKDRASVVISQRKARRYFGHDDPIDKRIEVGINEEYHDFVVKGVAAKIPENSSIRFDFLLPLERMPNYDRWADFWGSARVMAFALLPAGLNPSELIPKFSGFVREYYWPSIQIYQEHGLMALSDDPLQIGLQPLLDLHFNSEIRGGLTPPGDRLFSIVIIGISLTLLSVACINFINISIAQASNRVREYGVRKVVGAGRAQLIKQIWGEVLLLTFISLMVGIALAELALPIFNDAVNKHLDLSYGSTAIISLVVFGISVGVVAGIYPSVTLSGCHPVSLLRGNLKFGGSDIPVKLLIIGQFAVSVYLIISAIVIFEQIDYLKTKDRGFDDEHVVVIDASQVAKDRRSSLFAIFRSEFSNYTDIHGITASWRHFGVNTASTTVRSGDSTIDVQFFNIAPNFIEILGIKLSRGREFIQSPGADSEGSIIVNESLVRELGWDSPIGKSIPEFRNKKVVGVVQDFHFRSLHHRIEPVVLKIAHPEILQYLYVRVSPSGVSPTVNQLEQKWKQLNPELPFRFSFLKADIDAQYQDDERLHRISRYGSTLSIFVACIGIFGLGALAINKRVKEVGVRKVLGASEWGIVFLLSKEYVKLVILACFCAWPIALLSTQQWLENFAYHGSPSVRPFAISTFLAIMFALLAVSYHAWRAATANPVNSLRYE